MPGEAQIIARLDTNQLRADVDRAKGLIESGVASTKGDVRLSVDAGAARQQVGQFGAEINRLDASKIAAVGQQLETATSKGQLFTLQMAAASQQLGAIAGTFNQLKSSSVDAFKEFDSARAKLSTITPEGAKLANSLRDVSAELKFQVGGTQLANAGYTALSGGFTSSAESAKVLTAAARGAVGGFSDTDTVTKALVATLNAYGLSADDASTVVDKFASVQQNGLITINEYANQIAKVAPLAKTAGVSLDELNGFIATATATGVPAEQTFAGLRQAIANTLKPSSEARDLAAQLGIQFDAQALKTKGLAGILGELRAKGQDSAQVLTTLFGSIEAVSAIVPSTGDGFAKLQQNISASANSAGTAQANFDKVASSLSGRLTALQNEAQNALISLGESIVKVVNPLATGLTTLIRVFNALPQPLKDAIGLFVGAGASILSVSAAIAGVTAVIGPVASGLAALTGAGGALLAAFGTIGATLAGVATSSITLSGATAALGGVYATLAGTATAAAGALQAVLASAVAALPVVGVIAAGLAGLAAINFVRSTKDLEEFGSALDAIATTSEKTGNQTANLAARLKTLQTARQSGQADTGKEKAFLDLANQQLATLKRLSDEAKAAATAAPNNDQRQAALNTAAGYDREAQSLQTVVSQLQAAQKATSAKTTSGQAALALTKEQIKAAQEQAQAEAKLNFEKAQIDANAEAKKAELARQSDLKAQEKGIETQRDSAVDSLKAKQRAELQNQELAFKRELATFEATEQAKIQEQERTFKQAQAKERETLEAKIREDDRKYTAEKNKAQEAFQKRLSGAGEILSREAQIGAKPEDAAKLQRQFAEEDRIRRQVASAGISTGASDQQLASQAKAIAGVGSLANPEDAKKAEFALAEIKKRLEAQFAEDERQKDAAYQEQKRLEQADFDARQKAEEVAFQQTTLAPAKQALEQQIQEQRLAFEQNTLAPLKVRQQQEEQSLRLTYEQQLEQVRNAAKLREIELDAATQKQKLAAEGQFKEQQRLLDRENATAMAATLRAGGLDAAKSINAALAATGTTAAIGVGGGAIPKFSQGVENFAGGLAYVHAGELLMNLSSGTSVIPAGVVSEIANNQNSTTINITGREDPVSDLMGALLAMGSRRF